MAKQDEFYSTTGGKVGQLRRLMRRPTEKLSRGRGEGAPKRDGALTAAGMENRSEYARRLQRGLGRDGGSRYGGRHTSVSSLTFERH
jgi:hypothetical protein